jgi:aminoglycoside phosphotransferase (APT) family kinase protein
MRHLARLHEIDWRSGGLEFLPAPEPGRGAAARELARWEARIDRADLPREPVLVDALLWLRAHVPSSDEVTLVHGDYRLGNWLIERTAGGAHVVGILDWEMVHLGDPLEDFAWCTSVLWRAGTPYAAALLPPEVMAAEYEKASGRRVDPERLRFYELLSIVKMTAIMHTGIRAFRDGRAGDLRMAIFDHQLPFLHAALAMLRRWLPGG